MTFYPCGCPHAGGSPFCLIHERNLMTSRNGNSVLSMAEYRIGEAKIVNKSRDGALWLLFGVVFFGWIIGSAYFEAKAYNRITGANVSTWDAMFLELRVQDYSK